ncbi:unnamed protein product [Rhizoctonia solani]|uniref:Zn(2)-C6 fungal-type domain-containing protein n=1 Tax=Rhizoctonia solani TaxID=456999 RepID=A0A8H3CVK7_9AGAM|nr:unnamed protein product [Rhizoctonia solani]
MPSTSTPYDRSAQVGRSRSDVSLMRDKNGCITCRKCSGIEAGETSCGDCLRLNIQCLGVSHNRPDWLRNPEALKETKYRIKPEALKETKYRIKHHLTEHPVPRGRGPAPKRPHLDFYDLIKQYSPRVPTAEEYDQSMRLDRLQRMSPESPSHTTNYPSKYLSVQSNHHASPATPSPSTSYSPMPRGVMNQEFFYNQQGGVMNQEFFYNQQDAMYHDAYVSHNETFGHLVSPTSSQASASGSPYRLTHAQPDSLFLTTNPLSAYYQYPSDYLPEHISPSARRQL